jgi:hypothetical protein
VNTMVGPRRTREQLAMTGPSPESGPPYIGSSRPADALRLRWRRALGNGDALAFAAPTGTPVRESLTARGGRRVRSGAKPTRSPRPRRSISDARWQSRRSQHSRSPDQDLLRPSRVIGEGRPAPLRQARTQIGERGYCRRQGLARSESAPRRPHAAHRAMPPPVAPPSTDPALLHPAMSTASFHDLPS